MEARSRRVRLGWISGSEDCVVFTVAHFSERAPGESCDTTPDRIYLGRYGEDFDLLAVFALGFMLLRRLPKLCCVLPCFLLVAMFLVPVYVSLSALYVIAAF